MIRRLRGISKGYFLERAETRPTPAFFRFQSSPWHFILQASARDGGLRAQAAGTGPRRRQGPARIPRTQSPGEPGTFSRPRPDSPVFSSAPQPQAQLADGWAEAGPPPSALPDLPSQGGCWEPPQARGDLGTAGNAASLGEEPGRRPDCAAQGLRAWQPFWASTPFCSHGVRAPPLPPVWASKTSPVLRSELKSVYSPAN